MSGATPPHLTPAALFAEQARLDALRLEVYNRLLGTVHMKIKAASMLPNSPQMTYFDVPEWQPGCPRFDVKDCILYIAWNLRHAGFKVLYVSLNRLIISWQEQSIHYYQEESPIRQAMLAAASASKETATAVGGPGASSSRDRDAGKKRAASYKPTTEGVAGMLAGSGASKKPGSSTITFI
jgi:hypothetical protein